MVIEPAGTDPIVAGERVRLRLINATASDGTLSAEGKIMKMYTKAVAIVSGAGVLFSGFMSEQRFFANSCAFGEMCPTLGGVPACYLGLAAFALVLGTAVAALLGHVRRLVLLNAVAALALTGVIVATYASRLEIHAWWFSTVDYELGMPACFYGAFAFGGLCVASLVMLARSAQPHVVTQALS